MGQAILRHSLIGDEVVGRNVYDGVVSIEELKNNPHVTILGGPKQESNVHHGATEWCDRSIITNLSSTNKGGY